MSGWRKYELAQKHEDAGKRNTYLTYLYQRLFLDARRYLVCGHGEGVMDKMARTDLEKAINTLEHISTTSIPAAQMRRIIRETLLDLYKVRNREILALSIPKIILDNPGDL
jgi:hypothetical protein